MNLMRKANKKSRTGRLPSVASVVIASLAHATNPAGVTDDPSIADFNNGRSVPHVNNFADFDYLISDDFLFVPETNSFPQKVPDAPANSEDSSPDWNKTRYSYR